VIPTETAIEADIKLIESGIGNVRLGQKQTRRSSSAVERREHAIVTAVLFGPAERLDVLDRDFATGWFRGAAGVHHFGDVVGKGHGIGVARLIGPVSSVCPCGGVSSRT